MAKSLQYARQKWERKTGNAGEKWAGAKGRMSANFRGPEGMSPGPLTKAAYDAGIGAVSAGDFQASVSGKGGKWEENFRAGFSR